MSLITQYIDAHNDAIRAGNREADPAHKEAYRKWEEEKLAKERLAEEKGQQLQAHAAALKPQERKDFLESLDREVARIGKACPTLML